MVKEEGNSLFRWDQQWKIADEDLKDCLHSAENTSRFIQGICGWGKDRWVQAGGPWKSNHSWSWSQPCAGDLARLEPSLLFGGGGNLVFLQGMLCPWGLPPEPRNKMERKLNRRFEVKMETTEVLFYYYQKWKVLRSSILIDYDFIFYSYITG